MIDSPDLCGQVTVVRKLCKKMFKRYRECSRRTERIKAAGSELAMVLDTGDDDAEREAIIHLLDVIFEG